MTIKPGVDPPGSPVIWNPAAEGSYVSGGAPALLPPAVAPSPAAVRPRRRWGMAVALILVALLSGTVAAFTVHTLDRASGAVTTKTVIVPPSQQFSPGSTDVATVVATLEPSVVIIEVTYGAGQRAASGAATGVIVSADGYVLTNAHVVTGAATITVIPAGTSKTYTARLVGADAGADIALVRVSADTGLPAATFASSAGVQVGDDVVAIGNALNLGSTPSVTRGIVSATGRAIDTASGGHLSGLIQTDAPISSGNSGGPLANTGGKVVGLVTATATGSQSTAVENVGFAIPTDQVLPVVRRLGLTLTVG